MESEFKNGIDGRAGHAGDRKPLQQTCSLVHLKTENNNQPKLIHHRQFDQLSSRKKSKFYEGKMFPTKTCKSRDKLIHPFNKLR